MKPTPRALAIAAGIAVFVGLPLLLYALGDAPRRSVLKETFSVLTLLAFFAMIGQFFLARSNAALLDLFRPAQIQKVHKYIAYSAVAVILLHPALIVLPRFLEGGIRPWDAFVTMITTFDNIGILFGLAAWFALLVLFLTAFFRKNLFYRFETRYRGWRHFHGWLAVAFTFAALWHAIDLGRHADAVMSALLVTLALAGFAMLMKLYRTEPQPRPRTRPISEGAAT